MHTLWCFALVVAALVAGELSTAQSAVQSNFYRNAAEPDTAGFNYAELSDTDRQIIRDRRQKLKKFRSSLEIEFVRAAIKCCVNFTAARYSFSVPEVHEPSQSLPLAYGERGLVQRAGIDFSTLSNNDTLFEKFIYLDAMFEQNKTHEREQHTPEQLLEDYTESQDESLASVDMADSPRERGTEKDYQTYRFRRFLTRVLSKLAVRFVPRDSDGVNLLTTRIDRFQYLLVGKFKLGALNREVLPQFSARVAAEFLYTTTGLQVPSVIMSASEANVVAWLDITVLDCNEVAPLIDRAGPFSASVNESTALFTELLRVGVTDSDVTDPRTIRCNVAALDASNALAQRLVAARLVDSSGGVSMQNAVARCAFFVASRIDIRALCAASSSPVDAANCSLSATRRGFIEVPYSVYVDNTPSLHASSTAGLLSHETLVLRIYASNRHVPTLSPVPITTLFSGVRNVSEAGSPFERVPLENAARSSVDFVFANWTLSDADAGAFGRVAQCTLLRNSLETLVRPTQVLMQLAQSVRLRCSTRPNTPNMNCMLTLDRNDLLRRASVTQMEQERLLLETLPVDMLVDSEWLGVVRLDDSVVEGRQRNQLDELLRNGCRVADRFGTGAFTRICAIVNVTDAGAPARYAYYLVHTPYALVNTSAVRTQSKAISPSAIAAFCLRFRVVSRDYQTSSTAVNLLLGDLPTLSNLCSDTEFSDVRFDSESRPLAANWSVVGPMPGTDPQVRFAASYFEVDARLNKLRLREPLTSSQLSIIARRASSRVQLVLRVAVLARVGDARRAVLGWHGATLATAYVRVSVQLPPPANIGRVSRAIRLRTDAPANSLITRLPLQPPRTATSYAAEASFCAELFDIDTSTGFVRLRRELVGDVLDQLDVNFQCTFRPVRNVLLPAVALDVNIVFAYVNNLPPRFNTTRRDLQNITDVSATSDDPPVLIVTRLSENRPVNTVVTVLDAHDPDAPHGAMLARYLPTTDRRTTTKSLLTSYPNGVRYSLRGGDGLGRFKIDQNGTLRALATFDYEVQSSFWLLACVEDLFPIAPRNACAVLVVEIGNENDCPPMAVTPVYAGSLTNCVREQRAYTDANLRRTYDWKPCRATRVLTRISAYDLDLLNGLDALTHAHPDRFDTATLNDGPADRVLSQAAPGPETAPETLPAENDDDEVRLAANLQGLRSPFDDLRFDDTNYLIVDARRSIFGSDETDYLIDRLNQAAVRRIFRKRSEFEFRIADGDPDGLFQVSSDGTVSVRPNVTFDYENAPEYLLTVLIIDGVSGTEAANRLTATTYVEVRVTDVDENPPSCFEQTSPIYIPRIDTQYTQLAQIGGYHVDSAAASLEISANRQYELVNGTQYDLAENLFTVMLGTGLVYNRAPLTAVGHTFGLSVWLLNRERSVECTVEFVIVGNPDESRSNNSTVLPNRNQSPSNDDDYTNTDDTTASPEDFGPTTAAAAALTTATTSSPIPFRFGREQYKLFVSEATLPGSMLMRVPIFRTDSRPNAQQLRYCLLTADPSTTIYVDARTCTLYLAKPLDYETWSQVENVVELQLVLTDFRTVFDRTVILLSSVDHNELRPRFVKTVESVRLLEVTVNEPVGRLPELVGDSESASFAYNIDSVYGTSMTTDSDRLALLDLFSVSGDRYHQSLLITPKWTTLISSNLPPPLRFDVFVRVTKTPIGPPNANAGVFVVSQDNPSRFDVVHFVVLLAHDVTSDPFVLSRVDCAANLPLNVYLPWFIQPVSTLASSTSLSLRTAPIAGQLLAENFALLSITCPITRVAGNFAAVSAVRIDRFSGLLTTSAAGLRRLAEQTDEVRVINYLLTLINGQQINFSLRLNELSGTILTYPKWIDTLSLFDVLPDLQPTIRVNKESVCSVSSTESTPLANVTVSFTYAGRNMTFAGESKTFALQSLSVQSTHSDLLVDLDREAVFWQGSPASELSLSPETEIAFDAHNLYRPELTSRSALRVTMQRPVTAPNVEYAAELRETSHSDSSASRTCNWLPRSLLAPFSDELVNITAQSGGLFDVDFVELGGFRVCATRHLDFDALSQTTFLLPLLLTLIDRSCTASANGGQRTERTTLHIAVADENDNEPLVTLITYAEFDKTGKRKSPDGRIEQSLFHTSNNAPQTTLVSLDNLPESVGVDTLLMRIVAIDRDTDARLEFRVVDCQPEEIECPFEVRADTGSSVSSANLAVERATMGTAELRTRAPLDYETTATHKLAVEVFDAATSGLARQHRALVNVSITLLNVNDNAPRISAGTNNLITLRVVISSFPRRDLSDLQLYTFQITDADDQPPRLAPPSKTNSSAIKLSDYASSYNLQLTASNCSEFFGISRFRIINRITFDALRSAFASNWSNPLDEPTLDRVANHEALCEMRVRVIERGVVPPLQTPLNDTLVRLTIVFDDVAFGVRVGRNGSLDTVEVGAGDTQLVSPFSAPDLSSFTAYFERYAPYFTVANVLNLTVVTSMTRRSVGTTDESLSQIRIERMAVALRTARKSISPGPSFTVVEAVLVGARPTMTGDARLQVSNIFRIQNDDTLYAYWPADPSKLIDAVSRDVELGVHTFTFKLTVAYRSILPIESRLNSRPLDTFATRRQVTIYYPLFVRVTCIDRAGLASYGVVAELALRFDQFSSRSLDTELLDYLRRRVAAGYVAPPPPADITSRRVARSVASSSDANVYFVGYGPARATPDAVQTVWVTGSLTDRAALIRAFNDRATIYHLSRVNITSVRSASEHTDMSACNMRCMINNTRECLATSDFDTRLPHAAIERSSAPRGPPMLAKYKLLFPPIYSTYRCGCTEFALGETCSVSLLNCLRDEQFSQDNYAVCHRFLTQYYRSTPTPGGIPEKPYSVDYAMAGAADPVFEDSIFNVPSGIVVLVLVLSIVIILSLFGVLLFQCYRKRLFCFDKGGQLPQHSAAIPDGAQRLLPGSRFEGYTASTHTGPKPTVVLLDGDGMHTAELLTDAPLVAGMCISPTLRLPGAACSCARSRRHMHPGVPQNGDVVMQPAIDQVSLSGSDCPSITNSISLPAYHLPTCAFYAHTPMQRRMSASRAPDSLSLREIPSVMPSSMRSTPMPSDQVTFERQPYATNLPIMTANNVAGAYPLTTLTNPAVHHRSPSTTGVHVHNCATYASPECTRARMVPYATQPNGAPKDRSATLNTNSRHGKEKLFGKLFRGGKRGRKDGHEMRTLLDPSQQPSASVHQTTSLDALASYTLRQPHGNSCLHCHTMSTSPVLSHNPALRAAPGEVHAHAVMHNGQPVYVLCHCTNGAFGADTLGNRMAQPGLADTRLNTGPPSNTMGTPSTNESRTPQFARFSYPPAANLVTGVVMAPGGNVVPTINELTDENIPSEQCSPAKQTAMNLHASTTSHKSTSSAASNSANESTPRGTTSSSNFQRADGRASNKVDTTLSNKNQFKQQPDVIPFGEQATSIPPSMTSSYAEQVLNGASNAKPVYTMQVAAWNENGSVAQMSASPNAGATQQNEGSSPSRMNTFQRKRDTSTQQSASATAVESIDAALTNEPSPLVQRRISAQITAENDHDHDGKILVIIELSI